MMQVARVYGSREAGLNHMFAALALRNQTGNVRLQIESRNFSGRSEFHLVPDDAE